LLGRQLAAVVGERLLQFAPGCLLLLGVLIQLLATLADDLLDLLGTGAGGGALFGSAGKSGTGGSCTCGSGC
jgi:hypothetical protein